MSEPSGLAALSMDLPGMTHCPADGLHLDSFKEKTHLVCCCTQDANALSPLPDSLQNIQLLLDHHIERLKRARVRNIPVYRSRNYIETAR